MSEKIEIVKVFGGGKVTIPRLARKALGVRDGDYLGVTVQLNDAKIIYYPVEIKRTKSKT